jgi:hypothetical protein
MPRVTADNGKLLGDVTDESLLAYYRREEGYVIEGDDDEAEPSKPAHKRAAHKETAASKT